ncbi:MAG: hypothetical protein Q8P58_02930 [Candidatus Adlerbacteria bacterium]|nr:hypothetical protein [Candidatus Adlerbacteria bacterium]
MKNSRGFTPTFYSASKKRGFTAFFAVLVASLALAIGLSIYELLIRELELSQTARESQYAIYAADTGAECALYWDLNYSDSDGSAFATSSLDTSVGSGMTCNGQNIVIGAAPLNTPWTTDTPPRTSTSATTVFVISLGTTVEDPYAIVTVEKEATSPGNPSSTKVTSQGRNTYSSTGQVQIERALEVNY